jgi:hypothetical protein
MPPSTAITSTRSSLPASREKELKSPYLRADNRLGDVIAAIQAMGTYKFYKLEFASWADRISGDSEMGEHWRRVFEEHPEFFRLDGERKRASLVWRRQYPRRFHVDRQRVLTEEEYDALPGHEVQRVSRVPLTADDIRALVGTAINLHQRAIEADRERRWWLPLASAVGGLTGAIIGAVVPLLFS